jgi:hypothetical protein
MKNDRCPYCGKKDCVEEIAYDNASNYGSDNYKLACVHCGKPIYASIHRITVCRFVMKSDHSAEDNSFI